jgi:hypothetical protein
VSRSGVLGQLGLLVALDRTRVAAVLRRPRPGVWLSLLLPVALIAGALWAAGAEAMPDPRAPAGAVTLGFLAAAPLAFAGYGLLFRPADDPLLRRLGFGGRALFLERALRLLLLACAVALLLLVPYPRAPGLLAPALPIVLGGAFAAWGATLLALGLAADATARPDQRVGVASRLMGFDPELVRVGPLVYAPLAPLAAALIAGWWVGSGPAGAGNRAAVVALLAAAAALLAMRPFARALPRFAPRALEMAFAPPPEAGATGLVLDRGLGRLLPRRARAVLARDAAVTARRFRWSTTIVWPVAILSAVALARWGELPPVRAWVVAGGVLTLAVQGAAVIGLGRLEREGPRWLDHAAGLRVVDRWAGRWAYAFGLSLWLAVPLGLAWGLWAGVGTGWIWPAAGLLTAAAASAASIAAAGR